MRRLDRQHQIVLLDGELGVACREGRFGGRQRAFDGRGGARDDRIAERIRVGVVANRGGKVVREERVVTGRRQLLIALPVCVGPLFRIETGQPILQGQQAG
jgi:hypothetical protein